ncbi:MAG: hypothetical protein ACP5M9_04095 [Candidatus Micrarchaeia archaeon]
MPKLIYKYIEGRYLSQEYTKDGINIIDIYEKTNKGILMTKFSKTHGVISQIYMKQGTIPELFYKEYRNDFVIEEKQSKEKTSIDKRCDSCSGILYRELEYTEPWNITDVPVVPIFRCGSCSKRFYSMTKEYLEDLVVKNKDLFDDNEISELNKNKEEFINTLNAYIIRIFASKKISRLN